MQQRKGNGRSLNPAFNQEKYMDQNDTQQTPAVIEPAVALVAAQTAVEITPSAADPAIVADTTAAAVHPAHSVLNEIEDKLRLWYGDVDAEINALLTRLRALL
jgi:hypothetical protein